MNRPIDVDTESDRASDPDDPAKTPSAQVSNDIPPNAAEGESVPQRNVASSPRDAHRARDERRSLRFGATPKRRAVHPPVEYENISPSLRAKFSQPCPRFESVARLPSNTSLARRWDFFPTVFLYRLGNS